MADEQIIGMNYFDHQFLRKTDFETAQNYHVDRLRQHNRLLHVPGIVDGLQVNKTGDLSIKVTLGRAVDEECREVVLRCTVDPEVPPLLRVQTATGFQEMEHHIAGAAMSIDLSPLPASTPPDNSVFITIRQGTKKTTPSQDPGLKDLTDNETRLVERAVIEASTNSPSGAQLLLAQINRNNGGMINAILTTGCKNAGAWLADDSVISAKIDETDNVMVGGVPSQDTNTGSGVKTGHIKDGAVTDAKLRSHTIDDTQRAVGTDHIKNNAVTDTKLRSDANDANDAQRAVTTDHIRNNAVTDTKLRSDANDANDAQRAVTTNHIRNNAVTASKLRSDANDANDAQRAVTTNHIRNNAVTTAKIADDAVTQKKLAPLVRNGLVSAYCTIDGTLTAPTLLNHHNVRSFSREGTGLYKVTWVNNLSVDGPFFAFGLTPRRFCFVQMRTVAANSIELAVYNQNGALVDAKVAVMAFETTAES